jgi:hypothetical protein
MRPCLANKTTMKRLLLPLSLALFCLPLCAQSTPSEVLFQTHFAGPTGLQGWQDSAQTGVSLVPAEHGGQAVQIELPVASGPSTRAISITLPVEKMRGALIDFRARIKAENVAVPPQVYNGVKFMLVVEGPSGKQFP